MPEYDAVKDSGERREFGTGSVRDVRTGKGRYDLLPPIAIHRLARHFENGAIKYGDNNWKLGQPVSGYMDSGIRHMFNYLAGMRDEDHLSAAAFNILAAIHTEHEALAGNLPRELADVPGDEPRGAACICPRPGCSCPDGMTGRPYFEAARKAEVSAELAKLRADAEAGTPSHVPVALPLSLGWAGVELARRQGMASANRHATEATDAAVAARVKEYGPANPCADGGGCVCAVSS